MSASNSRRTKPDLPISPTGSCLTSCSYAENSSGMASCAESRAVGISDLAPSDPDGRLEEEVVDQVLDHLIRTFPCPAFGESERLPVPCRLGVSLHHREVCADVRCEVCLV